MVAAEVGRDRMLYWTIIGILIVLLAVLLYCTVTLSQQLVTVQEDVTELKQVSQNLETKVGALSTKEELQAPPPAKASK